MRRILFLLLSLLPLIVSASEPTSTPPEIIHTSWYCPDENISRRVDIYISKELRANSQELKVLYLIHGINGYEGSWTELGHAAEILEEMIADSLCEPMILVMPDCNRWVIKERPCHKKLWKSVIRYPFMSHEHQIEKSVSLLIDSIDSLYHPTTCAVAGLSDGARIAANIANYRPDRIHEVGLFSPVLYKAQLPKDSNLHYSIYIGKQDFLKPNGKRFHKRMLKNNFPHTFIELHGKHNWTMWQQCLRQFLSTLAISR